MQLHFRRFGSSRDVLVLLHGLFGSSINWQRQATAFAERFTVFAVDQRNHGQSPHSPVNTYPAMADDIRELLLDHGVKTAHILGHSMGGKTAMQFAALFPRMTSRLVVVDISPRAYDDTHNDILDTLTSLDLEGYPTREEIDIALSDRIRNPVVRQFLLANLRRTQTGGFVWRMNLHAIRQDFESLFEEIVVDPPFEGKTLFVRGERSDYVRDDDAAGIRVKFPQSELVTVSGAGHWVHADRPEEFTQMVMTFLTE